MKIAISATGTTLDAEVDPRFGRCQYFIIADPETMQFEAIDNSSATAAGGAGISAGQTIVGKGVQAVITGNCGPNTHQVLSSSGIQVITGVSGKIKEAIEGYKSGEFQTSAQANVADHFGMGGGMGMGRGMGRGRGMGFGISPPVSPAPQPQTPERELDELKVQSQALAQQLSEMQQRIQELGKKEK
ncbi:NifB/NifX family molybdenum-iron cluster-binding protein [Chloroflexota bacterium]